MNNQKITRPLRSISHQPERVYLDKQLLSGMWKIFASERSFEGSRLLEGGSEFSEMKGVRLFDLHTKHQALGIVLTN